MTNFAILSDVELELGAGMNVLTGETGAGKSLIVEAVNLLRGGRASADIPRAGADEAVVEAIVEVPEDLRARVAGVIEGAGLPASDEDSVYIRRVIQRGGRSRTYVNGALTTATRLAELGSWLVDLSGQHQHQGLVDPARHRETLDAFAGAAPLAAAMTEAWAELKRCDDELAALGGDEREREARCDFLRFQLEVAARIDETLMLVLAREIDEQRTELGEPRGRGERTVDVRARAATALDDAADEHLVLVALLLAPREA
ncbi:MAG TPA: AAA family ATPase, partial [Kofleriaceae bacterium]